MRYLMLAPLLLLINATSARGQSASCEVAKQSTLSLSSAGLAQVSNRGFIGIICRVPARPLLKPGEDRNGLRAAATAYQVSGDDVRKQVPSEIDETGGGGQNREIEYVMFNLNLPLDRPERDLEAHRYLDRLQKAAAGMLSDSQKEQLFAGTSQSISQHRAGRFRVECSVLDGTRVVGVGTVELEVLFKGRFSDSYGPPGYWQVQPKAEP